MEPSPECSSVHIPASDKRKDKPKLNEYNAAEVIDCPESRQKKSDCVFISYSHEDSDYAHRLECALKHEGFEVWIDDRIDYGTMWPQVIQDRLDACAALILIMTPSSYGSEWVQNELARAKDKGKPVFPLLLEGDYWLAVQATQCVDVRDAKLPPLGFYDRLGQVVPRHRTLSDDLADVDVDVSESSMPDLQVPNDTPTTGKRLNAIKISWLMCALGILLVLLLVFSSRIWPMPKLWSVLTKTLAPAPTETQMPATMPTQAALPQLTATPEGTSTPHPAPLPTSTAASTPVPTEPATAIATKPPTSTSAATGTPVATATATLVPMPPSTHTPGPTLTPTPRRLPAPEPIAPPNGASFVGWNAEVVLQWSEVPGLQSGEYYVVRIPYDEAGNVAEFWRPGTTFHLPAHFSGKDVGFSDRHYTWTVQVMLCRENCDRILDDAVKKQGVAVGSVSQDKLFYWHPDITGKTPKPTDTREPD